MRIAGIIRKSPTKKNVKESIMQQKDAIEKKVKADFPSIYPEIVWFIDENKSGDDPERPEINRLFRNVTDFDYAYCYSADRFCRDIIGLFWFRRYFLTGNGYQPHIGCKLRLLTTVPGLYEDDNRLNVWSFLIFAIMTIHAQIELYLIRTRTARGIAEAKKIPGKYSGRKFGSKNKKVKL